MPPRKSNVSAVSTANEEGTPMKEVKDGVNIEDLSLPKTMVQRLAKGVLPPNTQITKDAVLAMQKGATVFVNYLAQAANATAQTNNRRTIPPPAIFDALQELEFEFMCDWVSKELNKFNDTNTGKRNEYRRKLKEEERAKKQQEGEDGVEKGLDLGETVGDHGERAAKRARLSDGGGMEDEDRGGSKVNGHGDGDEEGVNGHGGAGEDEVVDLDQDNEDAGENEEEAQEEELEEVEEEDEEDDEDEFPDEGRRLSSVEADEMASDEEVRLEAASEDEDMSDEGSD